MMGGEHEQVLDTTERSKALAPKKKRKQAAAPNPLAVKKSSKVQKSSGADVQTKKRLRRKRQTAGEKS